MTDTAPPQELPALAWRTKHPGHRDWMLAQSDPRLIDGWNTEPLCSHTDALRLVAELRTERDNWKWNATESGRVLADAIELMKAAVTDAERYRWLRDLPWVCELNQFSGPRNKQYLWSVRFSSPRHDGNSNLGDAIDDARKLSGIADERQI